MRNAYIASAGHFAPDRIIQNAYFDTALGVNVSDWLEEVVQIKERRWMDAGESTSDLVVNASMRCLEKVGATADMIDLIIVATDTPDFISPSTASVVQHKLGAVHAGTFDINTACAGFVTALDVGSKYIKTDKKYNNVLIVGAYGMSKYLDLQDKKTVTLFADGAGAVLLRANEDPDTGYLSSELRSMGQYNEWMGIYGGGTSNPTTAELVAQGGHKLKFVKKFPPEINPQTWSSMARVLSEDTGVAPPDVDRYFITQININSIWETLDLLEVPLEKGYTIMHKYGYTGSACIPMAFSMAYEDGTVGPGDLVYFIGSGGGLAFASAAFRL